MWLNDIQGDWDEAGPKVNVRKTVQIPDGPQRAIVTWVTVDDNRPMIQVGLVFPEYGNIERKKTLFVNGHLEYVRSELAAVDCNTPKLSELPKKLKELVGRVIIVNARSKAGSPYQRYYFAGITNETVDPSAFGGGMDDSNPVEW